MSNSLMTDCRSPADLLYSNCQCLRQAADYLIAQADAQSRQAFQAPQAWLLGNALTERFFAA